MAKFIDVTNRMLADMLQRLERAFVCVLSHSYSSATTVRILLGYSGRVRHRKDLTILDQIPHKSPNLWASSEEPPRRRG